MLLTMEGRLNPCLLFTYRVPAERVRPLVPTGLELVTRGKWAFWNLVACRIEAMRPLGWPAILGLTYHHVAYRLYVRTAAAGGEPIDGLLFTRSDCDQPLLGLAGNLLTDFRFHGAKVCLWADPHCRLAVSADGADAWVEADPDPERELPPGSCFSSVEEARAFCKYRPIGLGVRGDRIHLAEVQRDEMRWRETPLSVRQAEWRYLDLFGGAELEIASSVEPLDYRWKLGASVPLA